MSSLLFEGPSFSDSVAVPVAAIDQEVGAGENQQPVKAAQSFVSDGEPPGTRTLNPLIKSQLLCQLS